MYDSARLPWETARPSITAVVGDSGTALTISSGGFLFKQTPSRMLICLPSVCFQLDRRSSFLVGGHNPLGGRRAFTAEWNGKQLISVQMKMLPADPGSVYAPFTVAIHSLTLHR